MRALLRKVNVPGALDDDPLALALHRSLRTASPAQAVRLVVERALRSYPDVYSAVIERIDFSPDKKQHISDEVVEALGLSLRTMYRYRARALRAIYSEIEEVTTRGDDGHGSTAFSSEARSYLAQGRYALRHPTLESLDIALLRFQSSIELEPAFAPAYAGTAEAHFALGVSMLRDPRASFRQARNAVAAGFQFDRDLPELHAISALLELFDGDDPQRACDALDRALAQDSENFCVRHAAALLALCRSEPAEALRHIAPVLDRADGTLALHTMFAVALSRAGGGAPGLRVLEDVVTTDASYAPARFELARLLAREGEYDRSRDHLTTLFTAEPRRAYLAALAFVTGRQGDPSPARLYLADRTPSLIGCGSHYLRAYAYLGLDMAREATAELMAAERAREPWVVMMRDDPLLGELHARSDAPAQPLKTA